jgi:hypothetical protein
LRISATLCQTNAKKNIFAFKKIAKPPQNALLFFLELLQGDYRFIGC